MNPGRELDALIAEKVMGWKWVSIDTVERNPGIKPYVVNGMAILPAFAADHEVGLDAKGVQWFRAAYALPKFSTSIADAWEVVERMSDGLRRSAYRLERKRFSHPRR